MVARDLRTVTFQFTNPGGFSDGDGVGADGITFVIVDTPLAVGGGGGSIGYGGLAPSVAVEFDTWNNSWDADGNHVGIDVNGSIISVAAAAVSPRLNNGAVWHAWVDYIGGTKTLEVRLSETPTRPETATLSQVIDLPAALGQTTAFMGFTSGTGAARNDHDLRSWQVRIFGAEIGTISLVSPVSDFSVMVETSGGGFTRTMKDGRVFEFDAAGRQSAEIDANGNRTEYVWLPNTSIPVVILEFGLS